jgi:ribonuclease-3
MASRRLQGVEDAELEALLGHRFARPELLARALTHRSFAYEGGEAADTAKDNEQLEFVGDAVLGLIVAEALYRRYPGSREGELTRLRAAVVSRRHLGAMSARMELGRWLRLGNGEDASGGRGKPALLADAIEAVIAALYLDGGLEAARRFVEAQVLEPALPRLEEAAMAVGDTFSGAVGDHKSALQEFLQAAGLGQPKYTLTDTSGPDHRRVFRVEVRIEAGESLAEAEGSSKKLAQQEAARLAFARLASERTADA